jgi:hypothetical protein
LIFEHQEALAREQEESAREERERKQAALRYSGTPTPTPPPTFQTHPLPVMWLEILVPGYISYRYGTDY